MRRSGNFSICLQQQSTASALFTLIFEWLLNGGYSLSSLSRIFFQMYSITFSHGKCRPERRKFLPCLTFTCMALTCVSAREGLLRVKRLSWERINSTQPFCCFLGDTVVHNVFWVKDHQGIIRLSFLDKIARCLGDIFGCRLSETYPKTPEGNSASKLTGITHAVFSNCVSVDVAVNRANNSL